jgi:hypothetical protein
MKELHNHIFSNTTCISKESMLRYINKQLTKSELYEVEKHMLDCDLCTDAMAGMKHAQNSSVLFAIDHQIDQRVNGGGRIRAPIMRKLMVAASILIVVFGTYFTVDLFNNSISSESDLAAYDDSKEGEAMPQEENFIQIVEEDESTEEESNLQESADEQPVQKVDLPDANQEAPTTELFTSTSTKIVNEVKEEIVTLNDETIAVKSELAEAEEEVDEVTSLERSDDLEGNRNENYGYTFADEVDKNKDAVSDEKNTDSRTVKKEDSKRKAKSGKKSRYKSNNSPSVSGEIVTDNLAATLSKQQTKYIETYKVIDYDVEYQNAEDFKQEAEAQSISPDYSSKEDKKVAEKTIEESIIKVTYKETLENAIHNFKNEKYKEALVQFDLILAKHPNDVNGLFYGGLSNYRLNEFEKGLPKLDLVLANNHTEFSQEAKWYKALTLIKLKSTNKAKILLQEIIKDSGFYKTKAEEKLKEI